MKNDRSDFLKEPKRYARSWFLPSIFLRRALLGLQQMHDIKKGRYLRHFVGFVNVSCAVF
ncbi:MAG TPA: hypothetical protein DD440_03570 [Porticoccaceae bacterium]|nr:hypothetical protein [Porticoccaceae bacterium]